MPSNIGYTQALWYEPDASGRLTEESAARFREDLQSTIRHSQQAFISDSPIHEFFPGLEVILPPELESGHRPRRRAPATRSQRQFAQSVVESPSEAMNDLQEREEEVRGAPEDDPIEYFKLLQGWRDLSEWDRVIALADDAPADIASSPDVQQLLALALNRRGAPGDQDRAIALMERLVDQTGGDGETFGILGRIYKDRYERAKAEDDPASAGENLEQALHHYRRGFDKNPNDYYPGINVVTLLLQQDDDAARAELDTIVPRVRAALQEKRETGRLDYWELATDCQLAAVARDWPEAEAAARQAAAQAPSPWMLETTVRDLLAVGEKLTDPSDRRRIEEIHDILRPVVTPPEAVE